MNPKKIGKSIKNCWSLCVKCLRWLKINVLNPSTITYERWKSPRDLRKMFVLQKFKGLRKTLVIYPTLLVETTLQNIK